ncbi:hypothetical protein [Agriterribacter humi]|nr:hypothetical protein [Agriterribacter humi]
MKARESIPKGMLYIINRISGMELAPVNEMVGVNIMPIVMQQASRIHHPL